MPINLTTPVLNKTQIAAKHIKFAADKTGMDFNYLLQTAQRESAFDPNAKAATSSATGLFQFVRQTWYETLHDFGGKHGYADYAKNIKQDANGRYFVPNQQAKSAILELRKDPKAASLMAAEFSKQNTQYLKTEIGHNPKAAEIYMAHFMGRNAAAKLINLNARAPDIRAAEVFPKHAAANQSIFYRNGQAKSIAEVYDNLAKHHTQLAMAKGLDPNMVEDVAKLIPFLPSNDGFFGNLFGTQNEAEAELKPIAYTGIGANSNGQAKSAFGSLNNRLMAQMSGQINGQESSQGQSPISNNPLPLPEMAHAVYSNASIAKVTNFFSVTNR